MRKYWQIFKINWDSVLVYRFNVLLWRVRMMLSFLTIYFFWGAVFSEYSQIADYSSASLLAYLVVAFFLQTLVFANDSFRITAEIATGDLNNYLLKPMGYLSQWLARDWSLKVLNLMCFMVEITALTLIFKLPVFFLTDWRRWLVFLAASVLAALLYFFFSFLVSSFSFWYPEHNGWPLRFLMLMFLDFLSGTAFPLDIFPQSLAALFKILPTTYFIFFPAQIYLGWLNPGEIVQGFLIMAVWLTVFIFLAKKAWQKGLQIYGAYGR